MPQPHGMFTGFEFVREGWWAHTLYERVDSELGDSLRQGRGSVSYSVVGDKILIEMPGTSGRITVALSNDPNRQSDSIFLPSDNSDDWEALDEVAADDVAHSLIHRLELDLGLSDCC